MPRRIWTSLAGLLVAGFLLDTSAASAREFRTWHPACATVYRVALSPRCRGLFPMARLRYARRARRPLRSRTGWRPVIPPFDQAQAEAYVHEIAPYRTYPFYPLIPAATPQPYVFGW